MQSPLYVMGLTENDILPFNRKPIDGPFLGYLCVMAQGLIPTILTEQQKEAPENIAPPAFCCWVGVPGFGPYHSHSVCFPNKNL
ncbi:hypothetical protein GDO78_005438 [Eleutherodactylus coqui]|uniref:Uncharacterized protein n=1 Tax=Eleutherodactylus coqui TaxID=57060 RepID=A0A8J6FKD2_ELECQ|nr:hypothetical protein GDO78_005438 [Eleutherodactylus coqui]